MDSQEVKVIPAEEDKPPVASILMVDDRPENLLALDCPASSRQIIVVSDGSTDAPATALRAFSQRARAFAERSFSV